MTSARQRKNEAFAAAFEGTGPAAYDIGRGVFCDFCDTDLTDDPRSGGCMFSTYAVGPCCAPEHLKSIAGYQELHLIRAWCPDGMSFADWVRDVIRGPGGSTVSVSGTIPPAYQRSGRGVAMAFKDAQTGEHETTITTEE